MTEDNTTSEAPQASAKPKTWLVKIYIAVYLLLIIGYVVHVMSAKEVLDPQRYVELTFPNYQSAEGATRDMKLQNALNPKEAHIRPWIDLTFEVKGLSHKINAGTKLDDASAVALARHILDEQSMPEEKRRIQTLPLYQTGAWGPHVWSGLLTTYNLFGLFLLLYVFVWGHLIAFLDKTRQSTAESLQTTRAARSEAETIEERRREIEQEVEAEKKQMEKNAETEFAAEREHILKMARHEAQGMIDNLRSSLDAEVAVAAEKLRAEITESALAEARTLVEKELRDADHEAALTAFVDDVKKVKLS